MPTTPEPVTSYTVTSNFTGTLNIMGWGEYPSIALEPGEQQIEASLIQIHMTLPVLPFLVNAGYILINPTP
jgi:hypothetical protein